MSLKVQPSLVPIRADGKSRIKAFYWGSMSAIVEPIGAVMGAALVMWMMAIIPYALAFAAGAMIFVVTEELIPESQTNGNTDVSHLRTHGWLCRHDGHGRGLRVKEY